MQSHAKINLLLEKVNQIEEIHQKETNRDRSYLDKTLLETSKLKRDIKKEREIIKEHQQQEPSESLISLLKKTENSIKRLDDVRKKLKTKPTFFAEKDDFFYHPIPELSNYFPDGIDKPDTQPRNGKRSR